MARYEDRGRGRKNYRRTDALFDLVMAGYAWIALSVALFSAPAGPGNVVTAAFVILNATRMVSQKGATDGA